jgi:hypothetical protein
MIELQVLEVPGLRQEIARDTEVVLETAKGSQLRARITRVIRTRTILRFWGVLECGVQFVCTLA